jgi:hypothetical protein
VDPVIQPEPVTIKESCAEERLKKIVAKRHASNRGQRREAGVPSWTVSEQNESACIEEGNREIANGLKNFFSETAEVGSEDFGKLEYSCSD